MGADRLRRDAPHRPGPYGQEDDAVRWVAVEDAADHVHLVAMLARQDGTRPTCWNDFYRVGEACRAAEERFGLRRTAARDRTAAHRPTRAESEKARRRGSREAPRVTLRRAVHAAAAAASSEQEFFARLDGAGLLVRKRFSTRNPGQVTGYAVALAGDTTRAGTPVWFGGGKLAADLTLPKLRQRWDPARTAAAGGPFTAAERNTLWEHAARAAADAASQIRDYAATDPAAAADAAWAAADTLRTAASALRSRALRQAADSFDRAARAPYGRIPRPTPTGKHLAERCPAAIYLRLSQRRPECGPDEAGAAPRSADRGHRRTARGATPCRPGNRRPPCRRVPAHCLPAGQARPAPHTSQPGTSRLPYAFDGRDRDRLVT